MPGTKPPVRRYIGLPRYSKAAALLPCLPKRYTVLPRRPFEAKGRPGDNPLIVHIAAPEELDTVARAVSEQARRCMRAFWPGPFTAVVPKSDRIPACVSGGLDTVAVRMPDHPVARAVIQAAGVPLAAPSANRSGSPSPTTAQHVIDDMQGRSDAI